MTRIIKEWDSYRFTKSDSILKEAPDMFGIETDAEIDFDAQKRKDAAHEKRREIIGGDILPYLHSYTMLDKMATMPTIQKKKEYIINYVRDDIRRKRREKQNGFTSNSQYSNEPIDEEALKRFADYVIDYYKDQDGVRFVRVSDSSSTYHYVDANGIDINKMQYYYMKFKDEEGLEIAKEMFPPNEYPRLYDSGLHNFWSHKLSGSDKERYDNAVLDAFKETGRWFKIQPLI